MTTPTLHTNDVANSSNFDHAGADNRGSGHGPDRVGSDPQITNHRVDRSGADHQARSPLDRGVIGDVGDAAGNGTDTRASRLASELDLPSAELTRSIIGAAIQVHRRLGPNLLEALYERAMCIELERRELAFRSQVPIPMTYEGRPIGDFYADLIVEHRVIVELKSVGMIQNAHLAQILTYLKITDLHLGLLINFNVPVLFRGVKRVIR